MSKTLLYTHQSFNNHEIPPGHVEHGGRYQSVEKTLEGGDFSDLDRRSAPIADFDMIALAHPDLYINDIKSKNPKTGLVQLDADTFLGPSSLDATLRAAGAGVAAIDALYAGEAKNAFVAARPPGHHAEQAQAMGFCIFNHVAVTALYGRQKYGAQKVAVVDFDVHHGNGTEAIFWDNQDAFFASSHEWPQYPGTGRISDRGGFDNIANAPLATGTSGEDFRRAWGDDLLPRLSDFAPDLIVISAGFDAHRDDPLGGLQLVEDDFAWITQQICDIAKQCCDQRVVSILEGGYDLDALGASAGAHVMALMNA